MRRDTHAACGSSRIRQTRFSQATPSADVHSGRATTPQTKPAERTRRTSFLRACFLADQTCTNRSRFAYFPGTGPPPRVIPVNEIARSTIGPTASATDYGGVKVRPRATVMPVTTAAKISVPAPRGFDALSGTDCSDRSDKVHRNIPAKRKVALAD